MFGIGSANLHMGYECLAKHDGQYSFRLLVQDHIWLILLYYALPLFFLGKLSIII